MNICEYKSENLKICKILSNISPDWLNIIYKDDTRNMLDDCCNNLHDDDNVVSNKQDWFNWCRLTPLDDIKVIIVGQEPDCINGLAFSCLNKVSKSLRNIYVCLMKCKLITQVPDHGNLTTWAAQGVLLLNIHTPDKVNVDLWKKYTDLVIQRICEYHYDKSNQLLFMVWGNLIIKKNIKKNIDCDFHEVLEWNHPTTMKKDVKLKFINCDHFLYANKFLISEGCDIINWDSINLSYVNYGNPEILNNASSILGIGPKHHIAFTDGSAFPNNKSKASRAGWSLMFVSGEFKDDVVCGNLDISKECASNIRAEGYAIIRVMELVELSVSTWDKLTIITDCKFWIEMLEKYMCKWTLSTFKSKSNSDLTIRMWQLYKKISSTHEINLVHVYSHNKEGWRDFDIGSYEKFCYDNNEFVDAKAGHARINLKPLDEVRSSNLK